MLVIVLALQTIFLCSYAQEKDMKKTPEERAKISTEKLKTSLSLSDEQTAKIYELNLRRIKEHKEFRENKLKLNSEMKKKKTEYRESFKTILTDEQFKTFKEMHKEKKFKKRNRKNQNR